MRQLVFIGLWAFSMVSYAQDDTVMVVLDEKDSLEFSELDITDNGEFESFSLLDSVVGEYNVFFTGENHLFRNSNYKLQLKMLKYLHKKRGVRHLLLEFGFSRGYLVDMYIQTGDSALYESLYDYSYKEYSKLYKGLYEYNKELPEDEKIHVHGIDMERSYLTSVKVMNLMLPEDDRPIPDSITLDVEALRSLMGYNDKMYDKGERGSRTLLSRTTTYSEYNTMSQIIEGFRRNDSLYRVYLDPENFLIFLEVVDGMEAELQRQDYETKRMFHAKIFRETFMFNQFVKLIDQNKGERFFSQFGRCHTATEEQDEWCNFYHFKTLASRISNSDHPTLKDKVCSIAAYYPKNENLWLESDENKQVRRLIDHLKLKKGGLTLVKVSDDSTYFGALFNKFQYIIINNNSLSEDFVDNNDEEEEDEDYDYYYDPNFTSFEGNYAYYYFNFKDLNSTFVGNGLDELESFMPAIGGSVSFFENYYTYGQASFHMLPEYKTDIDDSTTFSFGGWIGKGRVGSDITDNETFNFIPYAGLGFSRFKMEISDKFPTSTSDGFFTSEEVAATTYNNWGYLLDIGFDARLNVSFFTLALNAGYQFDVSGRKWRSGGSMVQGSSKASFSAPYVGVSAGFAIKN